MAETTPETKSESTGRKGKRLNNRDRAHALKLDGDGISRSEIARRLGCAPSTITELLSEFADTREEARRILRASAADMARRIVADGRPADLSRVLAGIDVIEQDAGRRGGVTVQIGVILPGMPGYKSERLQLPEVTVEPIPFASDPSQESER